MCRLTRSQLGGQLDSLVISCESGGLACNSVPFHIFLFWGTSWRDKSYLLLVERTAVQKCSLPPTHFHGKILCPLTVCFSIGQCYVIRCEASEIERACTYTSSSVAAMRNMSFPGSSDSKESACNAGEPGSIPGPGRSAGEGNGNPLQHSCLTWTILLIPEECENTEEQNE